MRRHYILILLAALLGTLPLIVHGCSCGHDFDFHLQSWLDAAHQIRHGTLYPQWAFSAAFNAGEPRFVFYPPLSWMLGALLTMVFPVAAAPVLFTFLALTAAGFAMHHLARHFASPNAALLAAMVYLANPYMLFNAFERTAYAELLAAAWIPLLFLAVLRRRPTVHGIAMPLALLWLTNAPAAVMGSYAFALLAAMRLVVPDMRAQVLSRGRLALTYIAGAGLGLALPAFYLVPAAYERRYVQIAMAILPNMRVQDNFLFGHTADAAHNVVLHTASVLAITLLAITVAATAALVLLHRRRRLTADNQGTAAAMAPAVMLLLLTLLIAFLLVPVSTPVWLHLPEMAFLQFPWRLLTILSAVLGFAIALLCHMRNQKSTGFGVAALLVPVALSLLCIHLYRQPCDASDTPAAVAQAFATHHGVLPTDEYTPADADNDVLRPDNPGYWLAADPGAAAANTIPNPAATHPNFDEGDLAPSETLSAQAPEHLTFHLRQPEFLILNLRAFPDWLVTLNRRQHPQPIQRDDGLFAFALPAGVSTLDITWRHTMDQQIGLGVSAGALLAFALCMRRSRKIV